MPEPYFLSSFGLNSPDALRLTKFYEGAFGCAVRVRERISNRRFEPWAGVRGGAERTVLQLGESTFEFLEFDYPGRPYPPALSPYDTRFQHLAIVVTDMARAMERLCQTIGWSAISTDGPQRLPESAGRVTAFKFRDPDGHPLEFLEFPCGHSATHWQNRATVGIHAGIDHSAISVAEVGRSILFFESLGLRVSGRSLNQGHEQRLLDGVPDPLVDVISLASSTPIPHVELLHYRSNAPSVAEASDPMDTAATRLIFRPSAAVAGIDASVPDRLFQDPDGHFIEINGTGGQTIRKE